MEVRDTGRLTRPDGRLVAWSECGPADGIPILRVPGTPGCRLSLRADREPWAERGLRMITTERPGFGASTRLPGRGFAEPADDLAAILDHLGLSAVAVFGGSGAAPHILALLARHPDRVTAATIAVGAVPLEAAEVSQLIGLNAQAHQLSMAGDFEGLRQLCGTTREAMLADPVAAIRHIMDAAPAGDQEIMTEPAWQRAYETGVREALRQGADGWADEALAIVTRWADVDLPAVKTSLTWWHGDGDRNCPVSGAQRLVAQIHGARFRLWTGAGHLTPHREEPAILDELLSRCR